MNKRPFARAVSSSIVRLGAGVAAALFFLPGALAQEDPVLIFDGENSVINTGLSPADLGIEGSGPKTMEAWALPRDFNEGGIFSVGNASEGQEFTLRTFPNPNVFMAQFWGPPDFGFDVPNALGNWIHYALVYDGTTVTAYANGQQVGSKDTALNTQSGFEFRIGVWRDQFFNGSIRDVRVWNVARSQAEIEANMSSSPLGQPGLMAWWPLDEGTGEVALDASGNGNDATIVSSFWTGEGPQFEYNPEIPADFVMDFGIGDGKVDELPLLRNRPDDFSLQADALRMTTTSEFFNSSAAVASVSNRSETQSFIVESEFVLNQFADVRASRPGLVVLGSTHVPVEDPFNPADEDNFYSLSFFPALPESLVGSLFPAIEPAGDDTAVIYVSRGFNGQVLAAARWDGRKPLPLPVALEDDFENPATDADWQAGGAQNVWQIGTPDGVGPALESGLRVASTNLVGNAPNDIEDWLRSPLIDLTGVTSATLSYREAFKMDGAIDTGTGEPFHHGRVSVLDENGVLIVELDRISGESNGWRDRGFTLPPEVMDQKVVVEFHLSTDDFTVEDDFWMVDDFAVRTAGEAGGSYVMKGEGNYLNGELRLDFTLTDLAAANGYSQTISATVASPLQGNLFGIGGRLQASPVGNPEIDFLNLSMTLGEEGVVIPTSEGAAFQYAFGSGPQLAGTENFALFAESDWTLQPASLQVATDQASGNSLAVTRMSAFEPGKSIRLDADIVLTSLDSTAGQVGLVLFGAEDPAVFDSNDPSTYYSFQYEFGGGNGDRIAVREGMTGTILYEAAFPAAPIAGGTYQFGFSGDFNEAGGLEFTASLNDGAGGEASVNGTMTASLEARNRFGIGAVQGGNDVWDVVLFAGNTRSELILDFALYRWTPENRDGNEIQLAEFTFFHEGEDLLETRRALADPDAMPVLSGPEPLDFHPRTDLIDGDIGTKWFDNAQPFQPIVFNFGDPVRIDGYMLWTAGDLPGRDPVSWTLEGSNDGINWELLDSVANNPTPTEREVRYMETGQFDVVREEQGVEINNFIADGSATPIVANGSSVTLSWNVSFAASVSIAPGVGEVNPAGTAVVAVPADSATTYTLTAVDGIGVEQTATVTVHSAESTSRTYRYVRFDVPDEAGLRGLNANSIQLAEFQFFNGETRVNPVGVANPGGNSPEAQSPSFILEADGKWLDFNKATLRENSSERSRLVFDFGAPVTIDGYRFVTAGDAPERDPIRWRLWGRDSADADWTAFEHMNFDYATTEARDAATQVFPLRVDVPAVPGVIDRFVIESLGSEIIATGSVAMVVDGSAIGLAWETAGATEVNLQPSASGLPSASSMQLLPPSTATTIMTLVAVGEAGTETREVVVRSVPVNHVETFRYIRFDLPDNSALRRIGANSIQLEKFFFFRNGARVDAVSVTNPFGDFPGGEAPGNLLGDTDSKWLDFNKANLNDSHLVFDFGAEVEIDSYQFGTANDADERDPLRWRLYGRNAQEDEWVLIENMSFNFPTPTARQTLTAVIPLPGFGTASPEPILSFSDWLDGRFPDANDRANPALVDPSAAPAGDGLSNVLKYAFGFDPMTPVSSADMPQAEFSNGKLTLTYPERVGATEIAYIPEKSYNLIDWNSQGITELLPIVDGDFQWVTIELEISDVENAFLRVKVVGP